MGITVSTPLLKKSFSILRRNYGCPGPDGLCIREIKKNYSYHEALVVHKIFSGDITSSYSKRTIIDYTGKERIIYVYPIYERWIQQYINLQLADTINSQLCSYVFGYRRGVNEHDAYDYILRTHQGSVMSLDVKDYYNSINLPLLEKILLKMQINEELVCLIKKAIHTKENVLPAGNVLSPRLSNVYLHLFDVQFPTGYARFADDLFFFDYQNENERLSLLFKAKAKLAEFHLVLNETKMRIVNNPTKDRLKGF